MPLLARQLHAQLNATHSIRRFVLQRFCHSHDFLLGLRIFLLLDALAHAGNRLHSVSAVDAGSIEQMLVPGTARKAVVVCQLSFALDQLAFRARRDSVWRRSELACFCDNALR